MIAGSSVAMLNGWYRKAGGGTRLAFWLLQITSIIWALLSYTFQDYLSWKALGATGPFVWLSCILVFAGMDKSVWKVLDPLVRYLSYITAALALYSIYGYHLIVMEERWLSAPVQYMVILMWFSGWTLLTSWNSRGTKLYVRFLPYIVFIITTIFTQTRSWFLMSIFLFIAFNYVSAIKYKTQKTFIKRYSASIGLSIVMILIAILFLHGPLAGAFDTFSSRSFEESRIGQYVQFFSQVQATDLILGSGPDASWEFSTGEGREEYHYFDNAYLWMAFIGGFPMMISYFVLIVFPGIKLFFSRVTGDDAAAAILVVLWGLACTGFSTYLNPSLTPHSYLICLLAGRCIGCLSESRNKVLIDRSVRFDKLRRNGRSVQRA
ncbi:MAG: hypothetical protein CXR31_07530 [Geobacter sp.]|nr:MAG: hypothetical protein CXR31_07530 [Geobacter sp.]